jgi:APA family basic amino acid/polyamine antiporter
VSSKIGFWAVFAIVTGSMIGSGVFMLPASLAPYGAWGLAGWMVAGCGAIALALVFGSLCAWYPQTGGPHVYVLHAFGSSAAFFTGWTYWVISCISTTAVIVTAIGYLTPFIGQHDPFIYFVLEALLLIAITALNLKGVKAAGSAEFVLTLLKFIPLVIMPLAALWFFKSSNFMVSESVAHLSISQLLARTTLLTLWGFVGLESATTPAGSVQNASVTIPKAIIWGTISVAILYLVNSIGIMGLIPGNLLVDSKAPYVDAAQHIFGGSWHFLISLIASIVCIGTINAWTLTSSQISLGLAEDRLLPSFFAHKNRNDAPMWGLLFSCFGILPLLFLTMNENLAQQITVVIDFSVTAFLFVYLICALGFLKLLVTRKEKIASFQLFYGILAILFCSWVIYETPLQILGIASLFVLSGLPVYIGWHWRSRN